MHPTPWHLNTYFLFHTVAGWLLCSHRGRATSGFYGSTYLKDKDTNDLKKLINPRLRWRTINYVHIRLAFAVNSVVINICSTDVGTKLWTCYQQTSWNTEPKRWKHFLTHSPCTCEKINGELLTCADERVEHKVILFNFSVVSHNQWQPSIHTGVSYEVSVFHAVRANELTLSICYLVEECASKQSLSWVIITSKAKNKKRKKEKSLTHRPK